MATVERLGREAADFPRGSLRLDAERTSSADQLNELKLPNGSDALRWESGPDRETQERTPGENCHRSMAAGGRQSSRRTTSAQRVLSDATLQSVHAHGEARPHRHLAYFHANWDTSGPHLGSRCSGTAVPGRLENRISAGTCRNRTSSSRNDRLNIRRNSRLPAHSPWVTLPPLVRDGAGPSPTLVR